MDLGVKKKADLLIHPIRLQILQTLTNGSLTTREISDALPSIPKSSIYRHLRLLLTGGMIKVAETRSVRGIQEKVYRLLQAPRLGPEDLAGLTRDDHLGYFATYTATLLQGFADYLDSISEIDLLADRTGYTEAIVYASSAELDEFGSALKQAMSRLVHNRPEPGRHRHKIAIITHPADRKGDDHG